MAIEIERKFLVESDAWRDGAGDGERIIQAYLIAEPAQTVRVRSRAGRGTLTIKGKTRGAARAEFEYEIPTDDVEAIIEALGTTLLIRKTRYVVTVGHHDFEVDVFDGDNAGLIVAEVELDDESESFQKPAWLGAEVTGDERYYNASLARRPWREWQE